MRVLQRVQCARRDPHREGRCPLRHDMYRPVPDYRRGDGPHVGRARLSRYLHVPSRWRPGQGKRQAPGGRAAGPGGGGAHGFGCLQTFTLTLDLSHKREGAGGSDGVSLEPLKTLQEPYLTQVGVPVGKQHGTQHLLQGNFAVGPYGHRPAQVL